MRLWGSLTVAAVVAMLALSGSAVGKGSRTLPRGFPYAAEIQATIRYDGTFSIRETGYTPCSNSEGEMVKVPQGSHTTLHFKRTLFFRHITVPVATPAELGGAASKLVVKPTITTHGEIKNDASAIIDESTAVKGEGGAGEPCHGVQENCNWALVPEPRTPYQELVVNDVGDEVKAWTLSVLGVNSTYPLDQLNDNCQIADDGDVELSALLESAVGSIPRKRSGSPK